MRTLQDLFNEEARRLDPLMILYLNNPSLAAGRAYQVPAMRWLAECSMPLQAAPDTDKWKKNVSDRFTIVVKNIQRIDAAGHGTKITKGELENQFFVDVARNVSKSVESVGQAAPGIAVKGVAVAVILLLAYFWWSRR